MTPLIRPSLTLETAPQADMSPEAYLEQQILTSINLLSSEVGGLRGQVRDLRTVLMGAGDGGETAFGRLPLVENQIAAHDKRIAGLESQTMQLQNLSNGASKVGAWFFTVLGIVIGGVVTGAIMVIVGRIMTGH
jgi:hypothetical protein